MGKARSIYGRFVPQSSRSPVTLDGLLCGTRLPVSNILEDHRNSQNSGIRSMKFRLARASDAPVLAAISIEVWLGTYIRKGVNAFFAEFALSEFTSSKLAALLEDPNEHVIVSENDDGLDGFI